MFLKMKWLSWGEQGSSLLKSVFSNISQWKTHFQYFLGTSSNEEHLINFRKKFKTFMLLRANKQNKERHIPILQI